MANPNSLRSLVQCWRLAEGSGRAACRQTVWLEVFRLTGVMAHANRDIPTDRRDDCQSEATSRIMANFERNHPNIEVLSSGVAFSRLVVRRVWLDFVRRDRGHDPLPGGPEGDPVPPPNMTTQPEPVDMRQAVQRVFRLMPAAEVDILVRVGMLGERIEDLVAEALLEEQELENPATAQAVRERWDKKTQRARKRFRTLWLQHTGHP